MLNADKPHRWKQDVQDSVRQYNQWFLQAAPKAYRDTRAVVVNDVEAALVATADMTNLTPRAVMRAPGILSTLRMSTAPPIARDRLAGLAYAPKPLISTLESGKIPPRMARADLLSHLTRICDVLGDLLDLDLFDWVASASPPTPRQREMAAVVVADRRCGAVSDPIVRNAQEQRQLALIEEWLTARGYVKLNPGHIPLTQMRAGTFSFRTLVKAGPSRDINMPIDAVVQPHTPTSSGLPILIEAKSAGDFTNTNKRRKEEATKIRQLRDAYGNGIGLLLFLCGYFDSGYLGYEAAEGLDWVWEHRIDDLADAGI